MRGNLTSSLALTALLVAATTTFADQTPYTKIVVFGDSLSDTHRYFEATGEPTAPYHAGRYCNGPLWIEQFASRLGMQILPENNYAFAGATTGRDNENDNDFTEPQDFPGLLDQIDEFIAATGTEGADPEALYVIWAGALDFVVMAENGGTPEATISNGVLNLSTAVATLSQLGARHIMVLNMPDIGLTPLATAMGNAAGLSYLVSIYNQNLQYGLSQLALAGMPTIQVPSDQVLQAMALNPATYGFTDVTTPYLLAEGDPDEYLFLDFLHPTTAAHKVLAERAINALLQRYSPANTPVTGQGRWHSLHGLVTAPGLQ